jgi:hypothetical protein
MKNYNKTFQGYYRYEKRNAIPADQGVYAVMSCKYQEKSKSVMLTKLLYIGQATDLNQRLNNHDHLNCWKKHLKPGEEICFNFTLIDDSDDLDRIEATLIYVNMPPCNEQGLENFNYLPTTVTCQGRYEMIQKVNVASKKTVR